MTTFGHWIALALAGALGTVARAGVTVVATRLFGTGFPWGTIAVNALGALCFGAIVGATRSRVAAISMAPSGRLRCAAGIIDKPCARCTFPIQGPP